MTSGFLRFDGDMMAEPSGTWVNGPEDESLRKSTTVAPVSSVPVVSLTTPLGSM